MQNPLGRDRWHKWRRRKKHIAPFAHREGIRYSEVRPVSGLANALGPAKRLPTPFGAVTLRFAFDSLTVAGAVPELSVDSHACTGFPFHPPTLCGWIRAPDNPFSLMHTACRNNSDRCIRVRSRHLVPARCPLTTWGRNVVLRRLIASLKRESDEAMWYASTELRR